MDKKVDFHTRKLIIRNFALHMGLSLCDYSALADGVKQHQLNSHVPFHYLQYVLIRLLNPLVKTIQLKQTKIYIAKQLPPSVLYERQIENISYHLFGTIAAAGLIQSNHFHAWQCNRRAIQEAVVEIASRGVTLKRTQVLIDFV